jgi:hypothetical protein
MEFARMVASPGETASGSIASLSGVVRSGGVDPPPMRQVMSSFLVYILVCAASTAPGDCDRHNAIDVVLGPEARNEIMCGLEAQEMFARTAILPKDGEYVKISCIRRRAVAED